MSSMISSITRGGSSLEAIRYFMSHLDLCIDLRPPTRTLQLD
jgi:hypothetical protein